MFGAPWVEVRVHERPPSLGTQRKPGGRKAHGSGTRGKRGTGRRRPTATGRETGGPATGTRRTSKGVPEPAIGGTGLTPQDQESIAFVVDSVIIYPAVPVSMYVKAEG